MEYTENYRLKKPAQTDYYDVDDFNYNADIIDGIIGNIPQAVYNGDAKAIEFRGGTVVVGGGGISGGGEGSYVLAAAGKNKLGGVKIGEGINVTSEGVISIDSNKIAAIIDKNVVDITTEEIKEIFKEE